MPPKHPDLASKLTAKEIENHHKLLLDLLNRVDKLKADKKRSNESFAEDIREAEDEIHSVRKVLETGERL